MDSCVWELPISICFAQEFNDVAYDYENKRSAVFMKFFDKGEETNVKIVVRYDDDNEVSISGCAFRISHWMV